MSVEPLAARLRELSRAAARTELELRGEIARLESEVRRLRLEAAFVARKPLDPQFYRPKYKPTGEVHLEKWRKRGAKRVAPIFKPL